MTDFLLEVGSEEIPDWMIMPALNQLQDAVQKLLDENEIGGMVKRAEATPRRLVIMAEGLRDRQSDSTEVIMGPPVKAGAGAAGGFAKKMGVSPEQLEKETTPKGEYLKFTRTVSGRNTRDLLGEALAGIILGLSWPKTMYWTGGPGGPRWIRPIRWLVALLGAEVIPFEIAGVDSGNITRGHRLLGRPNIIVTTSDFESQLAANGVILSADERRKKIEHDIGRLLEGHPLEVHSDPDLLRTLTYITEQPAAIFGQFDETYLRLPQEVLVTVMRHHQKYFSVRGRDGAIAPYFIAVMNTSGDPDGLVRHGNERVLRARFSDALFFWQADLKRPLEERLPDLAKVTFQAKLGSYLEKTNRNVALTKELGGNEHAQRAALLAKCDLTTDMVKEFTDLQGVVGGLYAKVQNEPEPVWRAIYDHYKPLSMEDAIPSTPEGRIVALADKLDTLRECFRVGLIPSGSKDPFALRRAAQGVVRILVEGRIEILLNEPDELQAFLLDRIRYYFREVRGFRYDEVNAVLASGMKHLPDVEARLEAVRQVRPTENFEPLAASFKRIQNILRQANFEADGAAIEENLLETGPERDLYTEFRRVTDTAKSSAYLPALEAIASLRPAVDRFFDKVLVNAPDERIRRNRLTLLSTLLTEFSAIAVFSEIVSTHTGLST